jgi:hypothetical protein
MLLNLLLESYAELHGLLMERYDTYLLEALNMVLNELNVPYGELKKMTEKELDAYVKDEKYTKSESVFRIIVPKVKREYPESSNQSNVIILPLSIEDESLTTGTACVMQEFAQDLDIPLNKSEQYVTFSTRTEKFDFHSVRERYKFYIIYFILYYGCL